MQTAIRSYQDLCEDKSLRDLPYRIETDKYGKIIMSPTRMQHGRWQFLIGQKLEALLNGVAVTEAAIQTSDGTKVADVVWYSESQWQRVKDDYDASIAGEICVEIFSPTNSDQEMQAQKALFFEKGAQEVC